MDSIKGAQRLGRTHEAFQSNPESAAPDIYSLLPTMCIFTQLNNINKLQIQTYIQIL